MCNCISHPNVNGEPGYRWNDNGPGGVRQPSPPPVGADETVLYDEPGRCGGLDGHCHHFMVIQRQYGYPVLAWNHGGGPGRVELAGAIWKLIAPTIAGLDTHARYWLLYAIYSTVHKAVQHAEVVERGTWRDAAIEKRIKVRRRGGRTRVEILTRAVTAIKWTPADVGCHWFAVDGTRSLCISTRSGGGKPSGYVLTVNRTDDPRVFASLAEAQTAAEVPHVAG